MKQLCMVLLLLSQLAIAAPLVYTGPGGGAAYRAELLARNLNVVGLETFEKFVIPPGEWSLSLGNNPVAINGGMTLSGGEGIYADNHLDLGHNTTPGGRQHVRSYLTDFIITFPYPVRAFSFTWSGYNQYGDWNNPDEIFNTLTAYYGGWSTTFTPAYAGYIAVISDTGIDSVQLGLTYHPELGGWPESTIGLDDIEFAAPEPGTWALIVLGAGVIYLSRKVRK